ncbi:methylosome protein 50 [Thraustotheca clavata]|uniref:Methylosome protein 50 n=1 Tax=Thraustotheca clavata TaxID=74557 RepID=A0A1W0ABU2_9STRA|nr:methylosome protein 50 [Thraustotheca clavata]
MWSSSDEQVDAVLSVAINAKSYVVAATSRLEGNDWSSSLRLFQYKGSEIIHLHAIRLPTTVGSIAWFEPDVVVCAGDDSDLYYCMFDFEKSVWCRLEPEVAHGHNDLISHVDVNGSFLASSSWDMNVKLWDLSSMDLLENYKEHTDKVWHVKWKNQNELASASQDRTVRLWDTRDRNSAAVFPTSFAAMSLAWHPSSDYLLTAGLEDGSIWTLDTRSLQECLSTLNQVHRSSVHGLAYNEKDTLASCSDDTTVAIWDAMASESPSQRLVYEEHKDYVHGVAWINATQVLTSSYDKSVHIWHL